MPAEARRDMLANMGRKRRKKEQVFTKKKYREHNMFMLQK